MSAERNTHLLDWLTDGHTHCQHGSKEWCEAYLHNARDVIKDQDAALASIQADNLRLKAQVDKLTADIAFADEQSAKVEALLEPHIQWSTPPSREGE